MEALWDYFSGEVSCSRFWYTIDFCWEAKNGNTGSSSIMTEDDNLEDESVHKRVLNTIKEKSHSSFPLKVNFMIFRFGQVAPINEPCHFWYKKTDEIGIKSFDKIFVYNEWGKKSLEIAWDIGDEQLEDEDEFIVQI